MEPLAHHQCSSPAFFRDLRGPALGFVTVHGGDLCHGARCCWRLGCHCRLAPWLTAGTQGRRSGRAQPCVGRSLLCPWERCADGHVLLHEVPNPVCAGGVLPWRSQLYLQLRQLLLAVPLSGIATMRGSFVLGGLLGRSFGSGCGGMLVGVPPQPVLLDLSGYHWGERPLHDAALHAVSKRTSCSIPPVSHVLLRYLLGVCLAAAVSEERDGRGGSGRRLGRGAADGVPFPSPRRPVRRRTLPRLRGRGSPGTAGLSLAAA
mmetsp:Transcript_52474/g.145500  ORF Transcript_52474/g.145500 Transcript_52474/m.145500 type:complete len:261 (-) Transcript_52474:405-1187(-)